MDPLLVIAVIATLGVAVLIVALVIALDQTRYLARYDLASFDEHSYLAMAPNFLQLMHDYGFTNPWPRRTDSLRAGYFRHQLRGILAERPAMVRRGFLDLHLNLQALLTVLRPFIDDAIVAEQLRLAAARVEFMADTRDRDRLLHFIDHARHFRADFQGQLTRHDRQLLDELRARDFFGTLRTCNATFREHGFTLLPELDVLRSWQSLDADAMALEILALPKSCRRNAMESVRLVPAAQG